MELNQEISIKKKVNAINDRSQKGLGCPLVLVEVCNVRMQVY